MRLFQIAATVACLSLPAVSSAQPISWMFVGVLDGTGSDPAIRAAFPAGQLFRMLMTYDRSAPEVLPRFAADPNIGAYLLSASATPGPLRYDLEIRTGWYRHWAWTDLIYVEPLSGQMANDGTLTESLRGHVIGSSPLWKPHFVEWSLGWPGFKFASDKLPGQFPHPFPVGRLGLGFRTCAYTVADPCPGGVQHRDHTTGTIHLVRRVRPRLIALPKSAHAYLTAVAILGEPKFLPDVEVERNTIELSMAHVHAVEGKPLCSAEDVNADGYLDLVCHVPTKEIQPREGEESYRLIAQTIDGDYISASYAWRSRLPER